MPNACEQGPGASLSTDYTALTAFAAMAIDVPNGGFTQIFQNHRGDSGVEEAAELLDRLSVPRAATAVRDALAVFHQYRSALDVSNPFDGLFGNIAEFRKIEFGARPYRARRG